ncbi:hypothetical protein DFH07DRAFT_769656 [Mycena maculata]|uniref:Uncharacterized protein n=1 Tax=Mycena maculata TaxID=230809 RepID=A0AAD7JKV3_9AGAR|nr:hypothetical protein DFH07DRAFT_769656 [Mycena maculata]
MTQGANMIAVVILASDRHPPGIRQACVGHVSGMWQSFGKVDGNSFHHSVANSDWIAAASEYHHHRTSGNGNTPRAAAPAPPDWCTAAGVEESSISAPYLDAPTTPPGEDHDVRRSAREWTMCRVWWGELGNVRPEERRCEDREAGEQGAGRRGIRGGGIRGAAGYTPRIIALLTRSARIGAETGHGELVEAGGRRSGGGNRGGGKESRRPAITLHEWHASTPSNSRKSTGIRAARYYEGHDISTRVHRKTKEIRRKGGDGWMV